MTVSSRLGFEDFCGIEIVKKQFMAMVCSNHDDRSLAMQHQETNPDQLQVYQDALELEEHLDEEKLAL